MVDMLDGKKAVLKGIGSVASRVCYEVEKLGEKSVASSVVE